MDMYSSQRNVERVAMYIINNELGREKNSSANNVNGKKEGVG